MTMLNNQMVYIVKWMFIFLQISIDAIFMAIFIAIDS